MTSHRLAHWCLAGCLLGALTCSPGSRPASGDAESRLEPHSIVEMVGSLNQFMGGVITPTPSSGEFLVLVELTPAKNDDAERLCRFLRAGHPVSLRIREQADKGPLLISDVTARGEVIIRCKRRREAERIIQRLHAERITAR